jgi:hypothetical protein
MPRPASEKSLPLVREAAALARGLWGNACDHPRFLPFWPAPVVRGGSTKEASPELAMFFFFSSRIGIIGSIVISLIVTVVVLKACGM